MALVGAPLAPARLAVMHDVCSQVVRGVLVQGARLRGQQLAKVNVPG